MGNKRVKSIPGFLGHFRSYLVAIKTVFNAGRQDVFNTCQQYTESVDGTDNRRQTGQFHVLISRQNICHKISAQFTPRSGQFPFIICKMISRSRSVWETYISIWTNILNSIKTIFLEISQLFQFGSNMLKISQAGPNILESLCSLECLSRLQLVSIFRCPPQWR